MKLTVASSPPPAAAARVAAASPCLVAVVVVATWVAAALFEQRALHKAQLGNNLRGGGKRAGQSRAGAAGSWQVKAFSSGSARSHFVAGTGS